MNFHFNRYLRRKLYEIYLQSVIFLFRCWLYFFPDYSRRHKTPHAPFCKMLHPINVKTLKRLPDWLTGLSFSSPLQHFSFHSLISVRIFWLLFFFFACVSVLGENMGKYIHKNSLCCIEDFFEKSLDCLRYFYLVSQ